MSDEEDAELRAQSSFERDYDRMHSQGKHEDVNEGLEKIVDDPKGNSHHLKGELEGKRSHRTRDIRIIFAYCPECIERGDIDHNGCGDCDELHGEGQEDPQEIIKLFETGDRSNIYD